MRFLCTNIGNCLLELTVEPVLFLYMLAIFSQYSVFQDLVYSRVCLEKYDPIICNDLQPTTNPNSSQEIVNYVQSTSSTWILLATFSTIIPSIFIAVYLGSWSDRFGRKWPVAVPPLGGALGSLVYIYIASNPNVPVSYICVASVLPGLCGGFTSCMMSCASYISSTTTKVQRTVRLSRLEAMTFVGGMLGPFISALFLSMASLSYAFLFMFICYVTAILYVAIFIPDLPESYVGPGHPASEQSECQVRESRKCDKNATNFPGESTSTNENSPLMEHYYSSCHQNTGECPHNSGRNTETESCCQRFFTSRHFVESLSACCKVRPNGGRRLIILILFATFITMTVTAGEPDVGFLFARDDPLTWTPQLYSYFIGFKYGVGAIVLLGVMPIFRKLNLTDVSICLIGIISRMAGLVLYGLCTSTTVAFLAPLVGLFSFISIPTMRAMLSKLVECNEQGKMFAFVAILEDVSTVSASALFNGLYPLLRQIFHGFVFQVAAICLLVPLSVLWSIRNKI